MTSFRTWSTLLRSAPTPLPHPTSHLPPFSPTFVGLFLTHPPFVFSCNPFLLAKFPAHHRAAPCARQTSVSLKGGPVQWSVAELIDALRGLPMELRSHEREESEQHLARVRKWGKGGG